jgi:multimeric flavodoxin WrbA
MKRALGIVGSPRKKGNTHILVSKILEGAQEEGAAVDLLFLGDMMILECDGCHACWKGQECSKKDDMLAVYPKIMESDALVFGTPVYWYGPTALMKGFIDRFVYFNCPENRERIRGKAVAVAVPFEEKEKETAELVIELFRRSFEYLELRLVGQVIVPGVTHRGEVAEKTEHLAGSYELGRKLIKDDAH